MKYVAITFDDGRQDNYLVAFPILKKYHMPASLYCTTGFVDGTWKKKEDWYSVDKPISIKQLMRLSETGWEIAIHGDKHITDVRDTEIAVRKMLSWGFVQENYGFSIPDSRSEEKKLNEFVTQLLGNKISYIRTGRKVNTKKFSTRVLYFLYKYMNCQRAYNMFNLPSVCKLKEIDRKNVYSVVIRFTDNPIMVYRFIDALPDESCVVLMFHSILSESNELYGSDPWNWKDEKFDLLCSLLFNEKNTSVITVIDMINLAKEGNYV